ncbi:MAG: hypothetical protein CVV17_12000, partial [Gammaproteobacteria bacterium HGW-Gammaproteobacteria-7]
MGVLMRAVLPVLLLVGVLNAAPSTADGPRAWIGQPQGTTRTAAMEGLADMPWFPLPSGVGVRLPAGETWLKIALPPGDSRSGALLTVSRAPIRIELWLPDAAAAGGSFGTG